MEVPRKTRERVQRRVLPRAIFQFQSRWAIGPRLNQVDRSALAVHRSGWQCNGAIAAWQNDFNVPALATDAPLPPTPRALPQPGAH